MIMPLLALFDVKRNIMGKKKCLADLRSEMQKYPV